MNVTAAVGETAFAAPGLAAKTRAAFRYGAP
jgi:hypothetical protein